MGKAQNDRIRAQVDKMKQKARDAAVERERDAQRKRWGMWMAAVVVVVAVAAIVYKYFVSTI